MFRLIYTSVQASGFKSRDFGSLCAEASRTNRELGINGLLLYNETEFMQCLEGPRDKVAAIYRKILEDQRHSDIRLLVFESIEDLFFKAWPMLGLATKPQAVLSAEPVAYTLLDHRLYRPWKSLGIGAADLIYEYAKVKAELEKAGEIELLSKVFEVYQY
jgi:hypothetical protein